MCYNMNFWWFGVSINDENTSEDPNALGSYVHLIWSVVTYFNYNWHTPKQKNIKYWSLVALINSSMGKDAHNAVSLQMQSIIVTL